MKRILPLATLLTTVPLIALAQSGADPAMVESGRYLVTAADCVACHGTSFAGGDPIASPMGDIYATNITPDPATGIGNWTVEQFSDVLRKGVAPRGHIFPAMPYTAYTGMTDDQVTAIYSYLMLDVPPVENVVPETDLPFPFVRPVMIGWNALFFDEGHAAGAVDVEGAEAERGRMLVETLGHCSACHTRRGQMMQPLGNAHLGGAIIDGWWAPNITGGAGGIGDWSDERLTQYLITGHTKGAIAAGEMSKVVSLSLSQLEASDIDAIVAYLRAVPPVTTSMESAVLTEPAAAATPVMAVEGNSPAGGAIDADGWTSLLTADTTDGVALYQSACASCHGINGNGSAGHDLPSLRTVGGVRSPQGATLVQVIAHGVNRQIGGRHALMPGFRDTMNDAQIAAVANHVRTAFGGVEGGIEAGQVANTLDGTLRTPWLIRNAHWLSIAGMVVGGLLLVGLIWWLIARVRHRPTRRARAQGS